eukprot:TRINITY_DN6210_c0_g1_i8.p1 TRINITY_DN6210_c0_g1~~TRINITY_DN6210_c0_g1_i8.p1  ORF type:complete len:210 (+),score=49.85 TRINITY_DN6210_c0_g1_i8:291-920(+)
MDNIFEAGVHSRPLSPSSPSSNGRLPYHWDGESHLIVNEDFYSFAPRTPEDKELDENDEMDFDIELDEPLELMEDCADFESESKASTNVTASTSSAVASILEPRPLPLVKPVMTLEAQLDFIMETTKKPPKVLVPEKKCRRNRKTPLQLLVLTEALQKLEKGQHMGKKQVVEMAVETGLTEMKVYKWFWDHGYKLQCITSIKACVLWFI